MKRNDLLALPEVRALLERARAANTNVEWAAVDRDISEWIAAHADLYPEDRQRQGRAQATAAGDQVSSAHAPTVGSRTPRQPAGPGSSQIRSKPPSEGPAGWTVAAPARQLARHTCPHCGESVPAEHDQSVCRRLEALLRRGEFAGAVDRLLTVPEAAELLSLSRSTVYELLQRGDLPAVRIGSARRIRASDLQSWIERLPR